MNKVDDKLDVTPIALTDELTSTAEYASSGEGRAAIQHGLADIRDGRIIEGKGTPAVLKRRAEARRA